MADLAPSLGHRMPGRRPVTASLGRNAVEPTLGLAPPSEADRVLEWRIRQIRARLPRAPPGRRDWVASWFQGRALCWPLATLRAPLRGGDLPDAPLRACQASPRRKR